MPRQNEAHSAAVRAIRLRLGRRKDVVLWQNQNGVAAFESGAKVKYGLVKGASDLVGIIKPSGRWFTIEVKTGGGAASPEQSMFIALIRNMGGFSTVIHASGEDDAANQAELALGRAQAGESE
jgi:hypothetical protein